MPKHATTPPTYGSAAARILTERLAIIDQVVLDAREELQNGYPFAAGVILDTQLANNDAWLWLEAHPRETSLS